jgi:transposase
MEHLLTDAQWARIALLPGREGTKGGRGQHNCRFVKAVLWLTCNGCRRRTLPAAWGNWHTTYMSVQRWMASGVWARVRAAVQQDDALHTLLWWTRPPCGRMSLPAARAKKRAGYARGRGGLITKLHAMADARGRPVRLGLTAGQRYNALQALPLLDGLAG